MPITKHHNGRSERGSRPHRRSTACAVAAALATVGTAVATTATSVASAAEVPSATAAGYSPARMTVNVGSPYVRPWGNVVDPHDPSRPLTVAYRINGALSATTQTVPAANGLYTIPLAWRLAYGTYTISVNVVDGKSDPVIGTQSVNVINPATRNPRATTSFAQANDLIHFLGTAFDPDRLPLGTPVYLYDNGRHIYSVMSSNRIYRFDMTLRLAPGRHLIQVVVPNYSTGTASAVPFSRWLVVVPPVPAWQLAYSGNQRIAATMLAAYGWGPDQMAPLINLWNRESGWNPRAANPSGAYGIPQALPGSKMATAGADWATNPATQIRWGLGYIKGRYGSPAAAWAHSQATNWY